MELRKLVEEFLVLNERQKAGIATQRERARWDELREKLSRWSGPPADAQPPQKKERP